MAPGKGGIIFTSKFLGGFSFETLHFFENHRPPLGLAHYKFDYT